GGAALAAARPRRAVAAVRGRPGPVHVTGGPRPRRRAVPDAGSDAGGRRRAGDHHRHRPGRADGAAVGARTGAGREPVPALRARLTEERPPAGPARHNHAMASASQHRVATRQLDRIGVVVHPSRDIDRPLRELRGWADGHDVAVVQVPIAGYERTVADPGEPAGCDLIVSIGGDGTMLAAIRAAVAVKLPVLGVAC